VRPFPFLLLAALLLGALSCSPKAGTPEEQILSLLQRAEAAAEEKDLSLLKKMISEGYSDDIGNDRQAVLAMVRYHFLRYEAVHLLTRAGDVHFPTPTVAEVTVYAAMAGEPIPSTTDLAALRGDLYRFDLTFESDEPASWLLVHAGWRRARAADLF
jgi:hypothetical protein